MNAMESWVGWSIYLFPVTIPLAAVLLGFILAIVPVSIGAFGAVRTALWIIRVEIFLVVCVAGLALLEALRGDVEEKYGNPGAFGLVFVGLPMFFILSVILIVVLFGAHELVRTKKRRSRRVKIEKD